MEGYPALAGFVSPTLLFGNGNVYVVDSLDGGSVTLEHVGLGGALAPPATASVTSVSNAAGTFLLPTGDWLLDSINPIPTTSALNAIPVDPTTGVPNGAAVPATTPTCGGSSANRYFFDAAGRFVIAACLGEAGATPTSYQVVTFDRTSGTFPTAAAALHAATPGYTIVALDPLGRYVVWTNGSSFFAQQMLPAGAGFAAAGAVMTVPSSLSTNNSINISPDGTHGVLAGATNAIALVDIDPTTGALTLHNTVTVASAGTAATTNVVFDPANPFVFVAEGTTPALHVFAYDSSGPAGLNSVATIACGATPGTPVLSIYRAPPKGKPGI
ncbi:MAG: hypothetical protein ACHREM_18245 [Polyangiales bacterium]